MPTPTLNMSSPYESIFHKSPNFSKLKVFGCLCYPWLGPYASNKLKSKSQPCVFLGYSLSQSAYLCFAKSTNKLHVSRHVQFVESVFPYNSYPTAPSNLPSPVSDWVPSLISVSSPPPQQLALSAPSSQRHADVSPSMVSSSCPSTTVGAIPSIISTPQVSTSSSQLHPPLQAPSLPVQPPPQHSQHPMITRSRNNIQKTIQKLSLHTIKPVIHQTEPSSLSQALTDPNCRAAMSDEYDALVCNGTWELVPPASVPNIVGCRWVYRIKRHSDGSIHRFKARLVAKGFH